MKDVAAQAGSGARGIRTPDLLIANETRYQLRHSPLCGRKLSTDTPGSNNRSTVKLTMSATGPLLRATLVEDGIQVEAERRPCHLRSCNRSCCYLV